MESVRTIQYIRELKAGGATQEQAEAQVIALENALTDLATKSDLKAEINALNSKIESARTELKYFFISFIIGSIHTPIIIGAMIWFFTR